MTTFIAVLGPPASGKSALTNALRTTPDVLVFRLRDHCFNQSRRDPILAAQLRNSPDPLGWLDDATVADVLVKAFQEQRFPSRTARAVLLENFPGNARQVELLVGVLAAGHCVCECLAAIELIVPEAALHQRVTSRRVCLSCEPDHGDLHRPAVPSATSPEHCATCGTRLATRPGDSPGIFVQRLDRFREHIPSIRSALTAHGVRVERLDGNQPLDRCAAKAADVVYRSRSFQRPASAART